MQYLNPGCNSGTLSTFHTYQPMSPGGLPLLSLSRHSSFFLMASCGVHTHIYRHTGSAMSAEAQITATSGVRGRHEHHQKDIGSTCGSHKMAKLTGDCRCQHPTKCFPHYLQDALGWEVKGGRRAVGGIQPVTQALHTTATASGTAITPDLATADVNRLCDWASK